VHRFRAWSLLADTLNPVGDLTKTSPPHQLLKALHLRADRRLGEVQFLSGLGGNCQDSAIATKRAQQLDRNVSAVVSTMHCRKLSNPHKSEAHYG